jgi:hypothetical protein
MKNNAQKFLKQLNQQTATTQEVKTYDKILTQACLSAERSCQRHRPEFYSIPSASTHPLPKATLINFESSTTQTQMDSKQDWIAPTPQSSSKIILRKHTRFTNHFEPNYKMPQNNPETYERPNLTRKLTINTKSDPRSPKTTQKH